MKSKFLSKLSLLIGLILLIDAFYIQAKAHVAQWLIEYSWEVSRGNDTAEKPWPWFDTQVSAKMTINDYPPLFVLAESSGQSLAFAPAFERQTNSATKVISAHRNTHFSLLKESKVGDRLTLEGIEGKVQRYRLVSYSIYDARKEFLLSSDPSKLLLFTCYPFDDLTTTSPLRFVAEFELI
ncbi:MAG: sortase [Kangiellaceae bacterium]|jgi:sortase A|nr:sortase [Kangiellaceae bacterium]